MSKTRDAAHAGPQPRWKQALSVPFHQISAARIWLMNVSLRLLADICLVQSSFHVRAHAGSIVLHPGFLRSPNISG
jgi:hypothetical protein